MGKIDVRNIEYGKKVYADLNHIGREIDGDTIVFTMSDEILDRHETVVKLDGVNLENYKKNPIILWMHQSSSNGFQDYNEDNVLGYGEPYFEEGKLKVKIHFESEETTGNVKADKIKRKINFGSLRMGSIGFIPKSGGYGNEKSGEDPEMFYIRELDLLEYSIVAIPSNPNAAAEGIDYKSIVDPIEEDDIIEPIEAVELNAPFRERAKYTIRLLKLKK